MRGNRIDDRSHVHNIGAESVKERYPYPKEIAEHRSVCDNLNLLYNRFSFDNGENSLFEKLDTGCKEFEKRVVKFKKEGVLSSDSLYLLKILNANVKKIAETFDVKIQITYQPMHRLLIGIGLGSPFSSTSLMTLHHVYGIPYIPGSAIKGVLRNCWIQEKFEGKEENALKCDVFRKLFGGNEDEETGIQAQAGALVFFDAFPVSCFRLEFDVQTPHYSTYYQSQKAPTDDQRLIPISIPAITETKFLITVTVDSDKCSQEYYNEVEEVLRRALTEYGLGAKTALGYGLGKCTNCQNI